MLVFILIIWKSLCSCVFQTVPKERECVLHLLHLSSAVCQSTTLAMRRNMRSSFKIKHRAHTCGHSKLKRSLTNAYPVVMENMGTCVYVYI